MDRILQPSNRRRFLKSATAAIALPSLEAFASESAAADRPRNFVAIGTYLGWHQNAFFPKETGSNYEMPATLSPLKASGTISRFSPASITERPTGMARGATFFVGSRQKRIRWIR